MEDFNHLEGDEKLKAENEFLKMKLMLENGAKFVTNEENELPAAIENEFLSNMAAFEKQFGEHKTIKVFDKIGRPAHFKPVAEIPDEEIEKAWQELSDHLDEHGVSLGVCSPNISKRELYRFATEELFEHETDDMDLPGWTTNFIYDEFHPDVVYDNSRLVEQDLFRDIFRKEDLFHEINYDKESLVFNSKLYETRESFIEMINRFKSLFDEIELLECNVISCQVGETDCEVKGNYKASAETERHKMFFEGDFKVELIRNEFEYWYFKKIQIGGLNAE
ncbi:MAG TPA: hypothetical protein VJU78_06395 [Chitinophagaceae bacterium]|nr:hypothetical protein [Chitinophagaceae bacterium]